MKSVGVDIGSNNIKVVEVQSTSKGFQILNYLIQPLTKTEVSDQEIEIIEFLRSLATRYDSSSVRMNFAIRQDRVAIRNKVFPFSDKNKISKSLAFELEEDIPFSSDSAIFDAKIVQYHGHSTEILACAVPNQHVQHLVQLTKDGNVEPYIISTEAPAFANVFEKWNEAAPERPPLPILDEDSESRPERNINIVLNIGHSRTLVCAFENGRLVGARSVLWGGRQIVDAIAKKYNLPPKEAQKEMELKAFILTSNSEDNYEAKIFSDLIAKCVRELARDLQLVLLEFKAEFNGQIQKIDMTGGVSLIQGLGPLLTQLLEAPVNRLNPLNSFQNVLFEKTDITQSRLSVALGLAIEGLKKPRNPAVNFLRGPFAKQSNKATVFWNTWGPTLQWSAAAIVVLFGWSILRSEFALKLEDSAKANLRQQAKNVAGLTGRSASEARIKEHIKISSQRAEELRRITGLAQMDSAMEVLKKINDAVPSKSSIKLDVRILNVVDSNVVLQGYVDNPQQMSLLQQALTNVAEEGKVQPVASNLAAWNNKTAFAFSFSVDRNIQKGAAQ